MGACRCLRLCSHVRVRVCECASVHAFLCPASSPWVPPAPHRRNWKNSKLKDDPNWTLEKEMAIRKGQPWPELVGGALGWWGGAGRGKNPEGGEHAGWAANRSRKGWCTRAGHAREMGAEK